MQHMFLTPVQLLITIRYNERMFGQRFFLEMYHCVVCFISQKHLLLELRKSRLSGILERSDRLATIRVLECIAALFSRKYIYKSAFNVIVSDGLICLTAFKISEVQLLIQR